MLKRLPIDPRGAALVKSVAYLVLEIDFIEKIPMCHLNKLFQSDRVWLM